MGEAGWQTDGLAGARNPGGAGEGSRQWMAAGLKPARATSRTRPSAQRVERKHSEDQLRWGRAAKGRRHLKSPVTVPAKYRVPLWGG